MMDRLYRRLLNLLPGEFDRADREEMWATYHERVENARHAGPRRRAWVELHEMKDLVLVVLVARLSFPTFDGLRQDVVIGARSLLRTPLVTALCITSLAIGIGATTVLFSAVDVWLFRPIGLPAADRLIAVGLADPESGRRFHPFSVRDYWDWSQRAETVELALWSRDPANLAVGEEVRRAQTLTVTSNLPEVLGVTMLAGRSLVPDDARPGAGRVALVTPALARSVGATVQEAVGKTLLLDGIAHAVVGVMHPEHGLPSDAADIWRPLQLTGSEARSGYTYRAVAKLRPDTSVEEAEEELDAIAAAVAMDVGEGRFPDAAVLPFREQVYSPELRSVGAVIGVAVSFVLLIACANIANLLLARGLSRQHELALRGALGAGRARLVQQLFVESTLIALLGGAIGVAAAYLGLDLMLRYVLPPEVPGWSVMTLDGRVLAAAASLTLGATMVFGLIPALRSSDVDLRTGLTGIGGVRAGRSGGRMMASFVVAEVAASVVLLVLSGLLIRSVLEMRRVDLGFDLEDTITFRVDVPPTSRRSEDELLTFSHDLAGRLGAEPGVTEVAFSSGHVLRLWSTVSYAIAGLAVPDDGRRPSAEYRAVSTSYAETLDLEIIAGRWFDSSTDVRGGLGVAVVSEALAALWWDSPSQAIGQSISTHSDASLRVVGVVRDAHLRGPSSPPPPTIFEPFVQRAERNTMWVVRHSGADDSIVARIRSIVRDIDPGLAVFSVMTGEQARADAMGEQIVGLRILGVLGSVALILTLVGVYGVVAHSVRRRTHELGLRVALGATRSGLLRYVLVGSARTAIVGLVVGVLISLVVGRGMGWLLFGVGPQDPPVIAASALLVLAAVTAAGIVPAWRASGADPMRVMREDPSS